MYDKHNVLSIMNAHVAAIKSRPDEEFEKAIRQHYTSMQHAYNNNKLFYKTIFKSHRFLLATMVVTEYFTSDTPLLSEVKKEFMGMNMLSENTVSSFLIFLRISRRMTIHPWNGDRRKLIYAITDKGIGEIRDLISTMASPLAGLFPAVDFTRKMQDEAFLTTFFRNYAAVVTTRLFHFDMVENINIFILKDAGHKIMLSLYCNSQPVNDGRVVTFPLSRISANCGVSRSHIKRIIIEAEQKALIAYNRSSNAITLLPGFINMFRNYIAYYFSSVCIGFGVAL